MEKGKKLLKNKKVLGILLLIILAWRRLYRGSPQAEAKGRTGGGKGLSGQGHGGGGDRE